MNANVTKEPIFLAPGAKPPEGGFKPWHYPRQDRYTHRYEKGEGWINSFQLVFVQEEFDSEGRPHAAALVRRTFLLKSVHTYRDSLTKFGSANARGFRVEYEVENLVLYRIDFSEPYSAWLWRQRRKFLLWLGQGLAHETGLLWYKEFRRFFWASKRKVNEEVLPAKVVRWAEQAIRRVSKEYDCVDNVRIALASSSPQRRRYRRAQKHGCCGFKDWEALGPDGRRYLLGFNYGH